MSLLYFKVKDILQMNLHTDLINAIQEKKLLIFVGSGLSRKFEFPDWNGLVKKVIEKEKLNDDKLESLLPVLESGLFTALDILTKLEKYKSTVYSIIEEELKVPKDADLELHKKLIELSGKIITTNYDDSFEKANDSIYHSTYDSIYKINNFKNKESFLFKLHGSIADPEKCILFKQDYEKLYNEENAPILKLKELFTTNTILFIGFSFSDPYVTDLFEKLDQMFKGFNKHFVLTTNPKDFDKFNFLIPIQIDSYNKGIEDFLDLSLSKYKINNQIDAKLLIDDLIINEKNENKAVKVAVLHPNPIDIELDIDTNKYINAFDKYDCEIYTGFLNYSTLQLIDDFDYLIIISKIFKGKIYIESEDLKSNLIQSSELFENIVNDKIPIILILNAECNLTTNQPSILIKTFKPSIFNKLLFKTLNKGEFDFLEDEINFNNISTIPKLLSNGKQVVKSIYGAVNKIQYISPKISNSIVGRISDQINLTNILLSLPRTQKVLNVKGSGGIGKTSIISKVAFELNKRGKYKEGVSFVSCESVQSYDEFEQILSSGFKLNNVQNFTEHLSQNFKRLDLLIILDNFETITNLEDEIEYGKIISLIEFASDHANIVLTSRETINKDFEIPYSLPSLTTDDAQALFFRSYTTKALNNKAELQILRSDVLENLLNNNPLAIKLVTKNLPSHKSISDLKEKLEANFFESTSEEFSIIYKRDVDLNIERTKSLFHSINYSYNKLSFKEKLAFELLHLFPDGIDIQQFKKCFKKKNSSNNIDDRELKSLENKSLLENFEGILKLQPIIRRFAEFQFNKRSLDIRSKYYSDAYVFNVYLLDVVEFIHRWETYSEALKVHDNFKNNLFLVLDYLDKINISKKSLIPDKIYLLNYINKLRLFIVNLKANEELLLNLEYIKEFFSDLPKADKYIDITKILIEYFYFTFDVAFEKLQQLVPLDSIISITQKIEDELEDRIIRLAFVIYSMEGFTLDYIKYLSIQERNSIRLEANLFYLGIYDLPHKKQNFYYFESLLNTNKLQISELEKYIKNLHEDLHLERLQCTYTLSKVKVIDRETIQKLVITNPYTNGLKELMFAFNEEKLDVKKSRFLKSLEHLAHIKYFYLESIYFFCKFLLESGDAEFDKYYQEGLSLSKKFYYSFLVLKFNNINNDKFLDYKVDYSYYPNIDMQEFVFSYNDRIQKYYSEKRHLFS